jgi:TetR/AcrR family transcriptional regulator, mexJK operon transcriptional repressor
MSAARPPAAPRPTRQGSGPGRPKDLGKRDAVLGAARTLFLEQGYSGTSMDGIAAAAGVSKLTVYSHFGDKEALFNAAVQATCNQLVPETLFVADTSAPLREQLLGIGRAFFTLVSSEAALATQRIMLSASTDDHIRQLFWQAGPARMTSALCNALAPRVASGELQIDDLELAAGQFFCLIKGELHSSMMCGLTSPVTAEVAERHVASSVDMFIRAYARPMRP